MNMQITFPGGLAVNAAFKGFTVLTDQKVENGGGGTAPEPFDMFLASLGTCAGFYALRFCQQREIDTEGLGLTLATEKDPEGKRLALVRLEIELPAGFPEKYREAIIRAVDQCAVKRHIVEPPRFEVVTFAGGRQPETVEV
ncbi:MAG TPA: OsmC family protein [Thermoanaerobaculia bacterium]|nr:OsmC family protein [Thermoanaerobaculia bacterium]